VLKLSTVCEKRKRKFYGDKLMSQTWTHKNSIPNGSPAPRREMRFSVSLRVSLQCAGFDNPIYQTKLGGLDRAESKI
jgi:hypothetical protein